MRKIIILQILHRVLSCNDDEAFDEARKKLNEYLQVNRDRRRERAWSFAAEALVSCSPCTLTSRCSCSGIAPTRAGIGRLHDVVKAVSAAIDSKYSCVSVSTIYAFADSLEFSHIAKLQLIFFVACPS